VLLGQAMRRMGSIAVSSLFDYLGPECGKCNIKGNGKNGKVIYCESCTFKSHVDCQLGIQKRANQYRVVDAGDEEVFFKCLSCIKESEECQLCGSAERIVEDKSADMVTDEEEKKSEEEVDCEIDEAELQVAADMDEKIKFRCKRCNVTAHMGCLIEKYVCGLNKVYMRRTIQANLRRSNWPRIGGLTKGVLNTLSMCPCVLIV
jgi:hypothetical protein